MKYKYPISFSFKPRNVTKVLLFALPIHRDKELILPLNEFFLLKIYYVKFKLHNNKAYNM